MVVNPNNFAESVNSLYAVFCYSEEPGYCTVHLINKGVTVEDGKVKIEFAHSGYTVSTDCLLDPPKTKDNPFFDCSYFSTI